MINVTVATENGRTKARVEANENMQRLNIEGLALLVDFAEFIQKELPLLWFAVGNKTLAELYQRSREFKVSAQPKGVEV